MSRFLPMLALAVILLNGPYSFALSNYDSFRCPGGAIVSVNDRLADVATRCDPPTSITTRTVTRRAGYAYSATGMATPYLEPVEREEWVYNQGSTSFIYYLTFENGVLTRIESGGYGR